MSPFVMWIGAAAVFVCLLLLWIDGICGEAKTGEAPGEAPTDLTDEGIDQYAMRTTPYVSYMDSEETLQHHEARIAKMRVWAATLEPKWRSAYMKWLDTSEYSVRQTRKYLRQQAAGRVAAKHAPRLPE